MEEYNEGEEMKWEGLSIAEPLSHVYLGKLMNMENDLDDELKRRSRAA